MARHILQQRRRKIVRELSAYNDRDLLELGFSPADFPAIINGSNRR
jgi:uncharacterized protein YjiS (DUF1127 family)